jgi:hypothetical protein
VTPRSESSQRFTSVHRTPTSVSSYRVTPTVDLNQVRGAKILLLSLCVKGVRKSPTSGSFHSWHLDLNLVRGAKRLLLSLCVKGFRRSPTSVSSHRVTPRSESSQRYKKTPSFSMRERCPQISYFCIFSQVTPRSESSQRCTGVHRTPTSVSSHRWHLDLNLVRGLQVSTEHLHMYILTGWHLDLNLVRGAKRLLLSLHVWKVSAHFETDVLLTFSV